MGVMDWWYRRYARKLALEHLVYLDTAKPRFDAIKKTLRRGEVPNERLYQMALAVRPDITDAGAEEIVKSVKHQARRSGLNDEGRPTPSFRDIVRFVAFHPTYNRVGRIPEGRTMSVYGGIADVISDDV